MCQKYKYIIPEIPPSNNKFIGRNAKPPAPITKAKVTLDYYFGNRIRRDPDNYSGKMVLDGLVKADIIQDDSFDCINLSLNGRYDKLNPRTEITVEIIENN